MKNLYYKLTAAGSVALLAPLSVFAQTPSGLTNSSTNLENVGKGLGQTSADATALPRLIGQLINALLGVLGIIFVVLVVYAGFLWMTAQGSEENVKKAKTMLTQAVIGLVIIVAAYAIASFVIGTLTTAVATG